MLAGMPARVYREWADYYALEPWGATRDNIHAGLIASTIANANRAKGAKPFTYDDFMVRNREVRKRDGIKNLYLALKGMSKSGS